MKPIILIFIVGFLLRVVSCLPIFNNIDLAYKNDTSSFKNIALNIAAGNGYSACQDSPYYHDSLRTPIYPMFLSLFYWSKISEKVLIFIQILMSAFLIVLVYKTALIFGNSTTANWSAAFVAFNSHLLAYSGYILSEVFFTFILTLAFFFLITKERSFFKAMISSFLYGIGILTQPILFYLAPLFFIIVIVYYNFYTALCSILIILSISLLWMVNQKDKTGYFTLTSLQSYNAYATYGNIANSYETGLTEETSRKTLLFNLTNKPFNDCSGNYNYIQEMSIKGRRLILDNLGLYFLSIPKYMIHALLPDVSEISRVWGWFKPGQGTLSVLNSQGLIAGVKHFNSNSSRGIFILVPFVLFWFYTLLQFGKSIWFYKTEKKILVLIIFIFTYIIIPGPASSPRFTLCVIPLISLIAGIGITSNIRTKVKSINLKSN